MSAQADTPDGVEPGAAGVVPPFPDPADQAAIVQGFNEMAAIKGGHAGAPQLRITVVRADRPRRGTRVGDYFEMRGRGEKVVIPPGRSFDISLMCAVIPILREKQTAADPTSWIHRKPYLLGPDPEEQVVLRLDLIGADE